MIVFELEVEECLYINMFKRTKRKGKERERETRQIDALLR